MIWMIFMKITMNKNKKSRKILIAVDDFIAALLSSKNLQQIVTELFIRGRELNYITQSQFTAMKNIRLNSAHYFIMEIPNKIELQQIAINHL